MDVGFSVGKDWLNFDSSLTLRMERLPIIGPALGRMVGNSQRFPGQVKYGDICIGLPVSANSARGVYASHVLEHLSYTNLETALQNTFKMLEPGGTFRLIVPDLQERARLYIEEVSNRSPEASANFMRNCHLGLEEPAKINFEMPPKADLSYALTSTRPFSVMGPVKSPSDRHALGARFRGQH